MTVNTMKAKRKFDMGTFIRANITKSPLLAIWTVALAAFAFWFVGRSMIARPLLTIPVVIAWAATIIWMVRAEINKTHSPTTLWLKGNLYNSITNALLSLILVVAIIGFLVGFITYAFFNASFSEDPAIAKEVTEAGQLGARWGSVTQNLENLLVFSMKTEMYRIWASIGLLVGLSIPSLIIFRSAKFNRSLIRRILTWLWIASPFIIFFFLRGVGEAGGSNPFYAIDTEQLWGGLLLSLILSVVAIVASFPLGVLLALGRQSKINGVPWWLTYGTAALLTAYLIVTFTLPNLEVAETTGNYIYALLPLLIPLIALFFQKGFKGNVMAGACTVFIECIRGVPLITLLFSGILLLQLFLPDGWEPNKIGRVMVAMTVFSAAYLAENIRGGLQAIPRGQYEAADSLGLSTYTKYTKIVLPQALRIVIPAIVGQFIGLFKDTSLVALVGLSDLLNVARRISSQQNWLTIRTEPFIFIFVVYFVVSYAMAWYSRRLEKQLGVGVR